MRARPEPGLCLVFQPFVITLAMNNGRTSSRTEFEQLNY